jgi:hypothetical protein
MNSFIYHTYLKYLVVIFLIAWMAGCTTTPALVSTSQPTTVAHGQDSLPAPDTAYSSFTTADFSGPGICVICHNGLKDQSGADVSMPVSWRSTMMANAAKDPIWQAKVSSEVERMPQLKEVIEKKCTTCHMPMAKTQAVNDNQTVTALGDGFFDTAHPLHPAAIDGVSCTLCHQIQKENLGSKESFSGGYMVDTHTTPPNRTIFGPYQQPVIQQMKGVSGFSPEYSVHMESAEHCGTCHNLYTPYVDAKGNILGEFPEQTPYSEWQNSQFGTENTSCQTCHMPLAEGGVVISTTPGKLSLRKPFYQHFFVGGNAFMNQVLADWSSDLEVRADPEHLTKTRERTLDQISRQTAQLTLAAHELKDNILTAQLQISPLTGHKFPTSFPSRRAWLHITITDAAGKVIFESGQPNADGTITGNAADFDPATYEPHYDLITQADQVQIYEPIMGDNEGQVTYTLLRGAQYLKDNRLLPAGTDKTQLPPEIAVYGQATGDDNFVGGGDLVTYQVNVTGGQGPYIIQAELLYESLSYRFVEDLLIDKTPLTERFGGYYGQADKTPLLVAKIQPATTR